MEKLGTRIKIAAAVCEASEAESLIRAGADEFYCGVDSPGYGYSLNRREMPHGNVQSLIELERIVEIAGAHNVPVHLTLNKTFFTKTEIDTVASTLDPITESGVSGFIVSDIGLMELLKKRYGAGGPRLHLSSVAAALNSETIDLYRQRYGIRRAILPRMSIGEVGAVTSGLPDLEFEALVLGWYCPNLDGICSFQHDLKSYDSGRFAMNITSNGCCLPYDIRMITERGAARPDNALGKMRQRFASTLVRMSAACDCCFIHDMSGMNVTSVKIVSRLMNSTQKINCVRFVRRVVGLVDKFQDGREFAFQTRKCYKSTFGFDCMQNCHMKDRTAAE